MIAKLPAKVALTPNHSTRNDPVEQSHIFPGNTEMGRLVRSHDWPTSPLGAIEDWPNQLQMTASIILNSSFPMFLLWGGEAMTLIYNDAYGKILGDRHPGALGESVRQVRAEIWPEIGPLIGHVFASGDPVYRKDLQLFIKRRQDEALEEAYFTFSYSPICDQDGNVDGLFCAVTETTEEVLGRQKLESLNQAKDEFISLASHQLRTPATGVKQYLGMLLGDFAGELTPSQREFVQHAYDSNERQLSTVSDLLSIAQADAGKIDLHRRSVDLVQLIDGILDEQTAKFADRRQTISFKHVDTACTVSIDEVRMRMVLENLVDNASKYTPQGNKIQLSLAHVAPTAALDNGPDKIVIRIRDHGVGIAKDDLKAIFDKFTRVDNPLSETVGGSGLGLYLARKIVELHGGTISVTSVVGKGSCFIISLPTV